MLKASKWVRNSWILVLGLLSGAGAAVAQVDQGVGEPLGERESYAFVRTLVGQATVASDGQGIGNTLERNQPLLSGDRLRTDGSSRIEILLPDRNRLTLDRDSVVNLDRLAFSGDRESRITVLALDEGELLLEVSDEALGDELPRIETGGATIYVQEPGLFRVRYDRDGYLEVLVRAGYAEMVTDQGSTIVRAGESAAAGGDRYGRTQISAAGPTDTLERWSDDLTRTAEQAGRTSRYVDSQLSYAASGLDGYGDWVAYSNVNYWRPRVAVGWSPYWDGRWAWTPSGYTWVSYEPWGWVPYHYGRWCMVPGYGWAWRPGTAYSPAWVYWHWSGGYAGWCPTGYYTDYYNPWYRGGFRFGFYGWAGGSWGIYSDWNFAPVHCFRDRNFRGQYRHGEELRREKGWPEVPRGLITTDTRDFRPDRIDRPDLLIHKISAEQKNRLNHDLPDVSDFVGRRRDLAPPIAKAISPDNPREPKLRFDEPRIAQTPQWRERDKANTPRIDTGQVASRDRKTNGGDAIAGKGDVRATQGWRGSAPLGTADSTDKRGGSPVGTTDKRGGGSPSEKTAEPRIAKAPAPRSDAYGDAKRAAPGLSADNRQGWKEHSSIGAGGKGDSSGTARGSDTRYSPVDRSGGSSASSSSKEERPHSSAPVERVISGTRRPAPQTGGGEKGGSDAYLSTRPTSPSSGSSDWQKRSPEASPRYDARGNGGSGGSTGSAGSTAKTTPRYEGGSQKYEAPRYGSGNNSGSGVKQQAPGQSSPRYGGGSSDAGKSYRSASPSQPSYSAPQQPQRQSTVKSAPSGGGSSSRSAQPSTGSRSSSNGSKSTGSSSKSSGSSTSSGSGSKSSGSGGKKDH